MEDNNKYIILFVEGETEKEFYEALLKYYSSISKTKICSCRVFNIKGISRFESRVPSKLKHEIIPQYPSAKLKVICCYDTDVFELAQKPPTNWKIVKKKVEDLGIDDFYELKAVRMMEDWFLKDIPGICRYLNIKVPSKLVGRDGLEKMKSLFKRGSHPKIYQKGSYCHKFISRLDFKILCKALKAELKDLERELGITL